MHCPLCRLFLFVSLVALVVGFPVEPLYLGKLLDEIKSGPPNLQKDSKVTQEILKHLRTFFSSKGNGIVVNPADLIGLHERLSDMQLDDHCTHKITAEKPLVTGNILHSSTLKFGISHFSWQDTDVFIDATLDATSELDTDLKIEVGEPWSAFGQHHCTRLFQKTFGIKAHSSGVVGFGMNATCSNARIEQAYDGKGFDLVFNFKVDTVAVILPEWKTQVGANNCNAEVGGINVGSYCRMVETIVSDKIAQAVHKVDTVEAPVVSARLEQIIQAKIGSEVRIPLIDLPSLPNVPIVVYE